MLCGLPPRAACRSTAAAAASMALMCAGSPIPGSPGLPLAVQDMGGPGSGKEKGRPTAAPDPSSAAFLDAASHDIAARRLTPGDDRAAAPELPLADAITPITTAVVAPDLGGWWRVDPETHAARPDLDTLGRRGGSHERQSDCD